MTVYSFAKIVGGGRYIYTIEIYKRQQRPVKEGKLMGADSIDQCYHSLCAIRYPGCSGLEEGELIKIEILSRHLRVTRKSPIQPAVTKEKNS